MKESTTYFSTFFKGFLFVFIGAILFSTKAILVKLSYRYEVDSISLLALRMLFSLPIYLLVLFWSLDVKGLQQVARKDYLKIILVGFCGYYLASLFDFLGLQYVTAGIERLILYAYPSIVLILSFLFFKQSIRPIQILALLLTYVGIGLAFADRTAAAESENFVLGASLVFLAAFTYAIYIATSGELIPKIGTKLFTVFSMSTAAVAVIIHHAIVYQLQLFHFPYQVYLFAFLMAVIATVIPSFLISEGIRLIGSNNAAIVGAVGPVSTILLAFLILGESFGLLQGIGTGIVIMGVLLLALNKKK